MFQLQIFDGEEPRDGQSYELTIRGKGFAQLFLGTTDEHGVLRAHVPPEARTATLVIGEDQQILDIAFGPADADDDLVMDDDTTAALEYAHEWADETSAVP